MQKAFAHTACALLARNKILLSMHCNKAGAKPPVGESDRNLNDISRDSVSTEFQLA